MRLKFKQLKLVSGRPIAFVSRDFAEKFNIVEGRRIEVLFKKKRIVLAVNSMENLLSSKEISFSKEAISYLRLKDGSKVDVSIALEPKSITYILKKLGGAKLSRKEIHEIILDIVNNSLNEAEIAYFISGVYDHGMTLKETIYLTEAMASTGKVLKWKTNKIVDKHCIGGIPGNKTTPLVVSICTAAGIIIPKTSSRAITSPAGTADAMETITNVTLSPEKFKEVVTKTGGCLAWGGSLGLAPADDKLIRVERLLNVDPEAQLIASILAKKISVGSKYVLIDIPYGVGAKVSFEKAKVLSKKFIQIGNYFKLKIKVLLTNGEQPIGNGIGPALSIKDVLRVLERKNPPKDLENKALKLSATIFEMVGKTKKGDGLKLAKEILCSGKALKKFNQIVNAQGRNKNLIGPAKFKHDLRASINLRIKSIDNKLISLLARKLGCPTDKSAGIYLYKHKGDSAKKGDILLTFYAESEKKLHDSLRFFHEHSPISLY